MKVLSPRHSGFCPGVQQAERKILALRDSQPGRRLCVLGPLIHNSIYIEHLDRLGIATIERPEDAPAGALVVIRTHGIPRGLEERLRRDFQVEDLTCPKVKQVQGIIARHAEAGGFVLLAGKKSHPEMHGLVSYARRHLVIEDEAGLAEFLESVRGDPEARRAEGCGRLLALSQTTGDAGLFREIKRRLEPVCAELGFDCRFHDSICSITSLRESEATKLQDECEVTFVVGDALSSNARKLFDRLKARRAATYFIESVKELESMDLSAWKSAQVVSSSSTPDFTEQKVIAYLKNR